MRSSSIEKCLRELFCLEHGIYPDGKMQVKHNYAINCHKKCHGTLLQKDESMEEDDNSFSTFFAETGTGVHTPRAVFVDLEPTVIKNLHLYWKLSRQIIFCRSLTRLGQEHTADYSTLATWSLGRWTLDCHLDSNMMIVKEDAANNYARGHYTIGKEQIHTTLEKVDLEVIRLEISWRSDSEDGWEVFWTTGLSCLPLIWRCGVHTVDFLNFW